MSLPVGKTRNDIINKSTHYKTIKNVRPALATFIIDVIQPYKRGQFQLWELSELDRIDKHRLILPTISQAHRMGVVLEDQGGNRFTKSWFAAGHGFTTAETFVTKGPLKINDEGEPAISTPPEGESVLESLEKISEFALQASIGLSASTSTIPPHDADAVILEANAVPHVLLPCGSNLLMRLRRV